MGHAGDVVKTIFDFLQSFTWVLRVLNEDVMVEGSVRVIVETHYSPHEWLLRARAAALLLPRLLCWDHDGLL